MRAFCLGMLTAGALLPQAALACHQLSQAVWMCAAGTPWAAVRWDTAGDGTTMILNDYVLSFSENFPGAEIRDDLTTLQEQFVTYAELMEADDAAPIEVTRQEIVEFTAGEAFRSLQLDRYDDIDTVSAVMLAEVGTARIMLYLDGPQTLDWPEIDSASRGVLDLLRESCADAQTCLSATEARVVTE
ncbi:hypothetical protein Z945_2064 [Sulfitobacter noctilucae]|uniref:hypothetical protein n=1 Tax=Sulfitobacter noctilucae TaxID=1342302 RepID=UPI0004696CF0|nr:hypothetical protein [Sulfitobacter noctilucae]KIN61079.1 hypothetical protein Z945_2064 [Sulfitobacter noctilucae]